eukprot:Nitzschia sp. Nitz4//scaffold10_size219509//95228//98055//NITZ4_001426-RA/size219509-augustus-gene-0.273-mRNA-1//-1//CDS//3329532914//3944//frame0
MTDHRHVSKETEPVRVFLRLRPMNKFETSKRSKDCIQLHDNPQLVTVDSMGLLDFTFHQVFDEYTPQLEVYTETISSLPRCLLNGISCAVMAYGQTGSGKTHTMLGEGLGVELNVRALGLEDESSRPVGERVDPRRNPGVTEGMIPRIVADLFERLDDAPDAVEYSIRCSMVEIYLERITDLLQPWREGLRIGTDDHGEACVTGAAELCCVDASDVYAMLARANAFRTKSATDQNMDSSRSHAVFTLRIERTDLDTGDQMSSRLLMLDMAGSEHRDPTPGGKETASGVEGRIINASLACVSNMIRGTLAQQGKSEIRYNPRAYLRTSKVAQLLRPCFGGNWITSIICTGSPSSYNIQETVHTIKFGQLAREVVNTPVPHQGLNTRAYRARLVESERRQEDLTTLVKMLAHECKHVKGRTKGKDSGNVPLWKVIEKITASTKPGDETDLDVAIGESGLKNSDQRILDMEQLVDQHQMERDRAESGMRDVMSEVASLRRQKESITKEKQRMSRELRDAKDEIKGLERKIQELQNYLRTSQFREKEAVLFLRQFRTFYFRLLKSKASQGSGTTKEITNAIGLTIPGVSDMDDLIDVDKLMYESGLIEKSELGTDTTTAEYIPSSAALDKSTQEADLAEQKELQLIQKMYGAEIEASMGRRLSTGSTSDLTLGQLVAYRQRLLETPAGRLAIKKEQELEKDLLEMGKKVVGLQNAVVAEKTMVEALSARQGAMGKMKAAQELHTLKQELERKSNDLQAIIWKMNELHLVNKTINTKVDSREQHVNFLEEHLNGLQSNYRELESDRLEMERRLRQENILLEDQLNGMATQIWQLGDNAALPLWRMVVPYSGEQVDLALRDPEEQRRLSLGKLEDHEIDGVVEIVEKN